MDMRKKLILVEDGAYDAREEKGRLEGGTREVVIAESVSHAVEMIMRRLGRFDLVVAGADFFGALHADPAVASASAADYLRLVARARLAAAIDGLSALVTFRDRFGIQLLANRGYRELRSGLCLRVGEAEGERGAAYPGDADDPRSGIGPEEYFCAGDGSIRRFLALRLPVCDIGLRPRCALSVSVDLEDISAAMRSRFETAASDEGALPFGLGLLESSGAGGEPTLDFPTL